MTQAEPLAELRHNPDSHAKLDRDEQEADAAEFQHIYQEESRPQENDANLEKELIGGNTGLEDAVHPNCVCDDESDENGPQHILDVWEGDVIRLTVYGKSFFNELPAVADDG